MTDNITPTVSGIPLRGADFANLSEALDYAATGATGLNFYSGRGQLTDSLGYRELRERSRSLALRLHGLGLARGSRVALVADTHPEFVLLFFACQYASLIPVPLPASVHLGGREAYVRHLRQMLRDCEASVAFAPPAFESFLLEATDGLDMVLAGSLDACEALAPAEALPEQPRAEEIAYLQYTSGSTSFPRGAMLTQRSVLINLAGIIRDGLRINDQDRFFSWLPFYHDMGLVGMLLGGVAAQRSVDLLPTRDFAMRPRTWLTLMSRNRSTMSFAPPFGYALCARRLRAPDIEQLDLSAWRLAGVGAEMIRPGWLRKFARTLAPAGFDWRAFVPSYGMAETAIGVSFALDAGLQVDTVDSEVLAETGEARAIVSRGDNDRVNHYVNCGVPLPDLEVEIRDEQGVAVGDRRCGQVFLRGGSVMSGYFNNPEATARTLSADGWLSTGDIGYRVGDSLYITGRSKDLLIINGRNIWPHDIERLAEQQPEVRPEDTSAFSVPGPEGSEVAVLVVQCRDHDAQRRSCLMERIHSSISAEFGISCFIELVPPRSLPRTSSGKLSRSAARREFLARHEDGAVLGGEPVESVVALARST